MKNILSAMKKKKCGIPEEKLSFFENIVKNYQERYGSNLVGLKYLDPEWDDEFSKALSEHLTREQRYKLYEYCGACNGAGEDKKRKAFALEHADISLAERLELFKKTFGRTGVLNDDNTITVNFKCGHGYYKRAREGKYVSPPQGVEGYFERCAGGRLYELQKALGIKLRIKSVDISPLSENINNPVIFTFGVAAN